MSTPTWREVAARAASLLLRYPDEPVLAALPILRSALAELPAAVGEPLGIVADHRAAADPMELASDYVQTFDFARRCCLYLTYYTHGDTRRRGEALVGFAAAYRAAGLRVIDGELPDFLPAVLDLAAVGGEHGWRLLRDNRAALHVLADALERQGSIYRHAVDAVRRTLPKATAADRAAAARLAHTDIPVEQVGLEPYRLVTSGGHP